MGFSSNVNSPPSGFVVPGCLILQEFDNGYVFDSPEVTYFQVSVHALISLQVVISARTSR